MESEEGGKCQCGCSAIPANKVRDFCLHCGHAYAIGCDFEKEQKEHLSRCRGCGVPGELTMPTYDSDCGVAILLSAEVGGRCIFCGHLYLTVGTVSFDIEERAHLAGCKGFRDSVDRPLEPVRRILELGPVNQDGTVFQRIGKHCLRVMLDGPGEHEAFVSDTEYELLGDGKWHRIGGR
ncbi:MAG: hypothetical protein ABSA41_20840 [Terriglobia bacterium]|jgi:transcription elongation factor Elf1